VIYSLIFVERNGHLALDVLSILKTENSSQFELYLP